MIVVYVDIPTIVNMEEILIDSMRNYLCPEVFFSKLIDTTKKLKILVWKCTPRPIVQ